MKSLPIPVAQARKNLSDVLTDAQNGRRIRLTRHGKPVGWIIGHAERARLDSSSGVKTPQSTKTPAKSSRSSQAPQSVKTPRPSRLRPKTR